MSDRAVPAPLPEPAEEDDRHPPRPPRSYMARRAHWCCVLAGLSLEHVTGRRRVALFIHSVSWGVGVTIENRFGGESIIVMVVHVALVS